MNVNDIKDVPGIMEREIAGQILQRQDALEDHYWSIERRKMKVFDVNDKEGQICIKDFLWRITEEMGEALEALELKESVDKVHEELADGLHFLVGLNIITGRGDIWLDVFNTECKYPWDGFPTYPQTCLNFLTKAGILGNTLKIKPWKQTPILTDLIYFDRCLRAFNHSYLKVCWSLGMTPRTLWDYYYRKSEVNLFRIRTKY